MRMSLFGCMVTKWLDYVETNGESLDKMEMMYTDKEEISDNDVNVPETCCVPDCGCELLGKQCYLVEEKGTEEDCDDKSVLKEYKFRCGCSELCFSFRGQKVGSSRRTFCDGSVMSRAYKSGFVHGFSKTVGTSGRLGSVGKWRGGRRVGTWWERLEGDAWLITNTNIQNKIFLYPDLTTALVGDIRPPDYLARSDLAVCEVVGLHSDGGILVPAIKQTGRTLPVSSGQLLYFSCASFIKN